MAPLLPRVCALEGCGGRFEPGDHRQRYCSPSHSQQARDIRRRHKNCAHCQKHITDGRFCGQECRWTYRQERRGKRGKRVIEPMAVLLPLGCKPEPVRLTMLNGEYGEIVRKIYCTKYDRCLAYAVSKRWSGFGCHGCDVDDSAPPEQGENPKGGNWSW